MNPQLDGQEQSSKRAEIATYSLEVLLAKPQKELRTMCKSLVKGYSNMTKTQMAQALVEATQTERALIEAQARLEEVQARQIAQPTEEETEKAEEVITHEFQERRVALSKFTQELWNEFRTLVPTLFDAVNGQWSHTWQVEVAALGGRIVRELDKMTNALGEPLSPFTKLTYRRYIFDILESALALESASPWYSQLKECLKVVQTSAARQMKDEANIKHKQQNRVTAIRRENKTSIDFQPIYEFACEVLSTVSDRKPSEWKLVSIALAISTGRRMAEIHSTAQFEYVSELEVRFTGQLKARGEAAEYYAQNPSYVIPTIVPAQYCVDGLNWLKANSKTIDDPDRVNARYSKDLSDAVGILRKRWNIETKQFKYKGLRAIYQEVCTKLFNPDPSNELYIAQILGHGRGDIASSGRVLDTLTPQSYKSDFLVNNAEIVLQR